MIGELYPTKYINVLGPLTTIIELLYEFIVAQLYPMMVKQDKIATIYFFCIMSIIATFFLIIVLPETRGKTKTQIEEIFRGKMQIEENFSKIEHEC